MTNRALDWFRQSERNLVQAEDSKRADRYESACFAAKQSVEKAFIAYWRN